MTWPVVVVGGGVAGLAAGWELHRQGTPVRLLEAADRVGGKIVTTDFAGRQVDEAADAFLARVPHGIELARELGLEADMIAPAARKAQVWSSGLHALPEPHVLGVPLARESAEALLGTEAADAIAADQARTEPDPVRPDDTIGSLVRRRLGDRIHEALVDPLIGSINAGDTDDLELAASSPQILAAADDGPSLVAALARQAAGRRSDAPVFHAFPAGMQTLTDALADQLGDVITTGVTVTSIEPLDDGLRVHTGNRASFGSGEGEITASGVVLAVPADAAARLVAGFPEAAAALAVIPMVSVTLIALAYPAGTVDQPDTMSGFVVPRSAPELTITACSYAHNKWPQLVRGPDPAVLGDLDVLRVSVGHGGDQHTPHLDDDALLDIVLADVATALGVTAAPVAHRISRWPHAFPQYVTGHLDRLGAAEAELNPAGIFLAGMSYRGIGIPANIEHGRNAARAAAVASP